MLEECLEDDGFVFGVVPAVVATDAWPNMVDELSVTAVLWFRGLLEDARFEDMSGEVKQKLQSTSVCLCVPQFSPKSYDAAFCP